MQGYNTQHKLLSAEEEAELIEYTQFGCGISATKLVEANVRMILQCVRKIQHISGGKFVDEEDLFQEGAYGLIYAAHKFKLETKHRFSTYALNWVEQYIRRFVMNHSKTVRVPVHVYGIARRLYYLRTTYNVTEYAELVEANTTDYDMRDAELLAAGKKPVTRLKFTEDTFNSMLSYMTGISINDCELNLTDDEGESRSIIDMTSSDLNIDDGYEDRNQLLDWLKKNLKPKQFEVITMRYGIGREPLTLDEAGVQIGLTRERVRQIQNEALKSLKGKAHCLPFEIFGVDPDSLSKV